MLLDQRELFNSIALLDYWSGLFHKAFQVDHFFFILHKHLWKNRATSSFWKEDRTLTKKKKKKIQTRKKISTDF